MRLTSTVGALLHHESAPYNGVVSFKSHDIAILTGVCRGGLG
jgi:hypothetical protein